MFTTIIVQPIFNVLVLIYSLIPGHNFGLALIVFTVLTRLAMWPLVKKQLHQTKAMIKLKPELKRIKKEAAGDRQKESRLMMELYKERGVNPFGQIGLMILQIPVFIALYSGISRVVNNNGEIISFSYPWIRDLPWMQTLATDITKFDNSLFGIVDLNRAAQGDQGWYLPALVIVLASAVLQYFVSKQLLPDAGDAQGLRGILKNAKGGQMADQSDVTAAVSRNMLFLTPILIAVITIRIPAALALYLLVGSIVAFIQQRKVLNQDEVELEALADGEVAKATIDTPEPVTQPSPNRPLKSRNKKRKKR